MADGANNGAPTGANSSAAGTDTRTGSYTTGLGLTAHDLQRPIRQLTPVITPVRNQIPRSFPRGKR